MLGLVAAPTLMYLTLTVSAAVRPGPFTVLSPSNVSASGSLVETPTTSWLRLATLTAIILVLAARLWWRRAAGIAAAMVVAAVAGSCWTLPQPVRDIQGADAQVCTTISSTPVCWPTWASAGSAALIAESRALLDSTPSAARPTAIYAIGRPIDDAIARVAYVGMPTKYASTSIHPNTHLLARAYATELVEDGHIASIAVEALTFRAYRVFGEDPNTAIRPWELTQDQRAVQDARLTTLIKRLAAMPDAAFFRVIVELHADPARYDWTLDQWLEHLP